MNLIPINQFQDFLFGASSEKSPFMDPEKVNSRFYVSPVKESMTEDLSPYDKARLVAQNEHASGNPVDFTANPTDNPICPPPEPFPKAQAPNWKMEAVMWMTIATGAALFFIILLTVCNVILICRLKTESAPSV